MHYHIKRFRYYDYISEVGGVCAGNKALDETLKRIEAEDTPQGTWHRIEECSLDSCPERIDR